MDTDGERQVPWAALLNASVKDSNIVSYQPKRPFEYLLRDPKGAFYHPWWAITDGFVTRCAPQAAHPTVPASAARGLSGFV